MERTRWIVYHATYCKSPYCVPFLGSRGLDANLTRAAFRAAEWLRNNQDKQGTYGEGHVNGFAFHALRLVGHSVEQGGGILNAEIIKKGGVGSIPGGPLAVYILGALASCQDPEKFYGLDLVTSLQNKLDNYPHVGFNHPFQYSLAVIALCSAGKDVGKNKYVNYIVPNIANQTAAAHASGDTLSMHIFALTCAKEFAKKERKFWLLRSIQDGINNASKVLHNRQQLDSTFGKNEVTAALSYQVSTQGSNKVDPLYDFVPYQNLWSRREDEFSRQSGLFVYWS